MRLRRVQGDVDRARSSLHGTYPGRVIVHSDQRRLGHGSESELSSRRAHLESHITLNLQMTTFGVGSVVARIDVGIFEGADEFNC